MNTYIEALAENLRQLRATHGLSLSQLSERSGVAKATLFKVERGRTNPTLETLVSIAETFDVPVHSLIAVESRVEVEVVRLGEGVDISDDASVGRVVRNQVIGAGTLEVHHQTFRPGANETSPSHGAGTREHVIVERGSILVGPVGEEVSLGPGDYATYLANRTHRWHAPDGEAVVWIIHTFPKVVSGAE
ncbi:XRE family transcriptional regulator [Leucobacter iarius]|uniref:helix-turn-helix domain-containing protein n=1 Tax=Leucobacter iarius TaxID=333963 RepID=UPI0031DF6323